MIEDDPNLGLSLELNLQMDGHKVTWAKSLKEAREIEAAGDFHICLLDLGLSDGNGIDLLREWRRKGAKLPIVILTAQGDEDSVVEGFQSGATDYVKKPYSYKELGARLKAILREPTLKEDQLRVGDLLILPEQRRVFFGNEEVPLNRREYDILKILAEHAGAVMTRESIVEKLGSDEEIFDRTVDSHISHLRARIKKAEVTSVRIKSEYGVGYRLVEND